MTVGPPAGLSMLSDMFPPERLGRPISIFLLSAPLGMGLAFIAGGELLQWLSTTSLLHEGLLDGVKPWQAAFLIVGFPGLLLVPAFLLMHEPRRRGAGSARPLSIRINCIGLPPIGPPPCGATDSEITPTWSTKR